VNQESNLQKNISKKRMALMMKILKLHRMSKIQNQLSKNLGSKKNEFPDQVVIDNFIQSFSDEELQNQAESILRPVLKIIDDCNSYDEVYERLSEKGLNTNQIEQILQKVLFISEAWGRVNGED
jgi:phage gp29-like protein